MKLSCQAPSRNQPGTVCGSKLGEDDRELALLAVVKVGRHYERLFPSPRIVKRCSRCKWWSIYEVNGGCEENGVRRY
jgi:hypothetical protein